MKGIDPQKNLPFMTLTSGQPFDLEKQGADCSASPFPDNQDLLFGILSLLIKDKTLIDCPLCLTLPFSVYHQSHSEKLLHEPMPQRV